MAAYKKILLVGASSDIGLALADQWIADGIEMIGTYRNISAELSMRRHSFVELLPCDFASNTSIDDCGRQIAAMGFAWDAVIFCPATMEPIGAFESCDMDVWADALQVNLTGQLRLLHQLLPLRHKQADMMPLVLFFAGGGTNSAPVNFSAYTMAKIGLIKMVELLDHEMPDVRFSIVGPGWVRTKIHAETIKAGNEASAGAAMETQRRLAAEEFTPMARVVECCQWLLNAPKNVIGGRNFSIAHDAWGTEALTRALTSDPDMYKLRRASNFFGKQGDTL